MHNYCGFTETVYPKYTSPAEGDIFMEILHDDILQTDIEMLRNRPKSLSLDLSSKLQFGCVPVMVSNWRCATSKIHHFS